MGPQQQCSSTIVQWNKALYCGCVRWIQMAPALKNLLFGVRLDAYWLPQSEHMFFCGYVRIPIKHVVAENRLFLSSSSAPEAHHDALW